MFQALLNLFRTSKKEPVQVKVEDRVEVKSSIETKPVIKSAPEAKKQKGRPKSVQPVKASNKNNKKSK